MHLDNERHLQLIQQDSKLRLSESKNVRRIGRGFVYSNWGSHSFCFGALPLSQYDPRLTWSIGDVIIHRQEKTSFETGIWRVMRSGRRNGNQTNRENVGKSETRSWLVLQLEHMYPYDRTDSTCKCFYFTVCFTWLDFILVRCHRPWMRTFRIWDEMAQRRIDRFDERWAVDKRNHELCHSSNINNNRRLTTKHQQQ